jgi:hypothetical protein
MNSSVLDRPRELQAPSPTPGRVALRGGSPTVRIVRTLAELEELEGIWNAWCDDPNADLDFYLASARCRPDIIRPHVMVLYRDGRPDCMMVGRLECCPLKLKVGYTTLFEPQVRRLFFLQGGFLGNFSAENIRVLLRELKKSLQGGEGDHAELARVIPNSVLDQIIRNEFSSLCTGQFAPLHEHRWAELPATFEQFLQGMPRKNRHEFRRHQKRLASDFPGKVKFRCYRHEHEVDELARAAETISAKTYQRALGVGFQPSAEVLDYLRAMARKDGMRGCALYVEEQPCAYFIGVQTKDSFHGNFMGFDPQFGKYSPGLLVLMHSIEHCFDPDSRATRIDFGWGDRRYKRVICNQSRQDGPMYLYSRSWAGLKLNCLQSATSFVDLSARKLLARSTFLQKMKRLWQGRLQESYAVESEYAD